MPINASWNYPTLMCTPPGRAGGVFPAETVLPLEPEAYAVTQEGEIWRVTVKHSGEQCCTPGRVLWCWWSRLRRFEAIRLRRTGYRLYGATASKESICR